MAGGHAMWKSAESFPETEMAAGAGPSPVEVSPDPGLAARGDAWLGEQVRAGDDRAFAALVVRYERKLIRVLTRLVHDEELARDLAQETFWKVYTRLDRFDTARRVG